MLLGKKKKNMAHRIKKTNARKSSPVVAWLGCAAAPAQVFCQLVGLERLDRANNGGTLVTAYLLALHPVTSRYSVCLSSIPNRSIQGGRLPNNFIFGLAFTSRLSVSARCKRRASYRVTLGSAARSKGKKEPSLHGKTALHAS